MAGKGLGTGGGGVLESIFPPAGHPGTGGMPTTPGGSTPANHPHIAKVQARTARTGTPVPTPDEQRLAAYQRGPYANVDPINTSDPLYNYAQAIIDQYSTKTQKNDKLQQQKFNDFVNNLNTNNPDTGPTLQQDIIRLLAPNYNPMGFYNNLPVEQSDVGAHPGDNMNTLAQQLLNSPAGSTYTGSGDPQSSVLSHSGTSKNPVTGDRGLPIGRWLGSAADFVGGLFGGGSSGQNKNAQLATAKNSLQTALERIQQRTPGLDTNTAYHLLEYNILNDKGDIKPKDAQALYAKWSQTPTQSPQAEAQQLYPALMNLEQQKMQNAADYIGMTSKERTAAGLSSSVLTAIGMPTWVAKTPENVQRYLQLYSQYAEQSAMSDMVKLLSPQQTRFRQAAKAGVSAGTSTPQNLQQFISDYITGTNLGIDPVTGSAYDSSSGVNTDIAQTP